MELELKIKRLHADAVIPQYATDGAACFDLHAIMPELPSGNCRLDTGAARGFRTGLAVEIPPGWVLQVYSRSGHGFKSDVSLSNAVGVIDADYRGEVMVKLRNDGAEPFYVMKGMRIAQAMLAPAPRVRFVVVDELSDTKRGAGGLGSTGA